MKFEYIINSEDRTFFENAAAGEWLFLDPDGAGHTKKFGEITLLWLNTVRSCRDREAFDRDFIPLVSSGAIILQEDITVAECFEILYKQYESNEKMIETLYAVLPKAAESKKNHDYDLLINTWNVFKDIVFCFEYGNFSDLAEDEKTEIRLDWVKPLGSQLFRTVEQCQIVPAYQTSQERYLLGEDLRHLLFDEDVPDVRACPRCGKLFMDRRGKYCPSCRNDKTYFDKFRSNTARYAHKKVNDRLCRCGIDNTSFLAESNYYWSRLCGEPVPDNPEFSQDIQTQEDYIAWLQSIYDSTIKKRRKNS